MRRMYWRPRRVSRTALILISVAAVAGFVGLQRYPNRKREPYLQQKIAAAQLAQSAFKAIREERLRRRLPIDPESDPAQTGLVGSLVTPVTTNAGSLASKQTSVNPNFAAVIVEWLRELNLSEGDVVAVGYSGSFPAINIAVLAALETLRLKPVIISSASSSQWGANDPEFLWLDMEHHLKKRKLISEVSVAASIGGIEDRGLGMKKRGQRILGEAIAQYSLTFIEPKDFDDSIEQRIRLYRQHAGAKPIGAYVNVGGGTTSVGRKQGKKLFKPGINRRPPLASLPVDSVMHRFVIDGVPVIHLVKIHELAGQYGFPIQPTTTPPVGEGKIFYRERTNKTLAVVLLLGILASLYLFVRSDLGFRITRGGRRSDDSAHPEPMV